MIHVEKILYPTDFSPYANQAYFHAVALAESHGACLDIVHVLPPTRVFSQVAEVAIPVIGVAPADRDYWRGQLEQIRPLNKRIPVRHALLAGNPATEIVRYAAEERIDLIVLGTHGRTGLSRLLMGSVAEKVLHNAPCSVMVVKMPKPVPAAEKVTANAQAYAM